MMKDETTGRFSSGVSRNTLLAVLYSAFVFSPALVYLHLVAGPTVSVSVAWFTLILFIELGRLQGTSFSRQEALFITILATPILAPITFIYNAWFSQSEYVSQFGLSGEIPYWFAPSPESGAFASRSFLHPAFLTPFVLYVVAWILGFALSLVLGIFSREVFIEVENLPFPIESMSAEAIITLSEGEGKRAINILSIFALVGFGWGFIVYTLPWVLKAWTGRQLTLVPVPFVDMSETVERIGMGGAILGVATDITFISAAFVLSESTLLSMILGSIAVSFFGNWLSVAFDLAPVSWWVPKMGIALALQRSTLYFWGSPMIGLGLAAGLVPLLRRPKILIRAFSSMSRSVGKARKTQAFSFYKTFLIPFCICIVAGIGIWVIFVPDFLRNFFFIIIPLVVLTPLAANLIQGRMIGETGVSTGSLAPVLNAFYLSTGYSKVDIWFVPTPIQGAMYQYPEMASSGANWLQYFKLSELCNMDMRSFIKWWILLEPAFLISLVFLQAFWNIAPIPSGAFPGVAIFWPIQAIFQLLWIKGLQFNLFIPSWVIGGFLAGAGLFALSEFTPLSMIGLVVGASSATPYAVTWLIGFILVSIFKKFLGERWWNENRRNAAAGLVIGETIAVVIAVSISLTLQAMWIRPF